MSLNPGRGNYTDGTLENSMHRAFPLGPSAHGEKQENLQVLWAHFHMKCHTQSLPDPSPQRHTALGGGSDLVLEAVGVIARVVSWLLSQGHGFKDAPL